MMRPTEVRTLTVFGGPPAFVEPLHVGRPCNAAAVTRQLAGMKPNHAPGR